MVATWYLFQYTADLRRHEPRNIGLAMDAPDRWHFHFRGIDMAGRVNGQQLRDLKLDKELYRQWAEYFQRKASEGAWEQALSLQSRRPTNFSVVKGGTILEDSPAWEMTALNLFNELVDVPKSNKTPLDMALEVIKQSGVTTERDVPLKGRWRAGGPQVDVRFKFAARRAGMLNLMDVSTPTFSSLTTLRARMDAVARVQTLPRLLALIPLGGAHEFDPSLDGLLQSIEADGGVVDIDQENAAEDLQERLA
ncbi:hypothetical protein [Nesterenkonia populi]